MYKRKFPKGLFIAGMILSVIIGYYAGACFRMGKTNDLVHIIGRAEKVLDDPFKNYWNGEYTIYGILAVFVLFIVAFMYYITAQKDYMFGREQGSSKWEDVEKVNEALADHDNSAKNPENAMVRKEYNGFFYQKIAGIRYQMKKWMK